ncbi:MAG TPA: hypothetical protein DCZ38_02530 [Coxiellaceae bacterium]|nr:hypothetical protein [Coxiellaceae bacterium]
MIQGSKGIEACPRAKTRWAGAVPKKHNPDSRSNERFGEPHILRFAEALIIKIWLNWKSIVLCE